MIQVLIFMLIGCAIMFALSAIGSKEPDETKQNRVEYFKGQAK